MMRFLTMMAVLSALSACGVGEMAATTGAGAAAKTEELKQAQKTQQQIEQRLDDANRKAAEQRQAADEMQ